MFRFYYIIGISIPLIIYYILKANYYCAHEDRYDEQKRFELVLSIIGHVKSRGRIKTISMNEDKLPKEGGYIMYANHQGKYDALGILCAHKTPCAVVMDAERSRVMLTNQVVNLVHGKRLERNNLKQQFGELEKLTAEVKEGRRYIYFPEGGYNRNGNKLQEFRPGAFKCAKNAQAPIVPVAIYDSHLPFDFNSLKKVTTQVYFMDPIYYDEYKEMSTREISNMVKERIEQQIEVLAQNRIKNGYNNNFKIYKNS